MTAKKRAPASGAAGLFDDMAGAPLELRQQTIPAAKRGDLHLFLILAPNAAHVRAVDNKPGRPAYLKREPAWRQTDEVLARNLMDAAGVALEARGWSDAYWRHPKRGAVIGSRGRDKFAVIDPRELKASELE